MVHIEFTEEEKRELHYERYSHPHPRVQQKMEALLLKSQGLSHGKIGSIAGVSQKTLREYFDINMFLMPVLFVFSWLQLII